MADNEISEEKNLSTVITILKDSNAAEELILDEVNSHQYTLASPDSQNFIRDVPPLLDKIGGFLSILVDISKDILSNGSMLVRNDNEEKVEKRNNGNRKTGGKDSASSGVSFTDITKDFSKQNWLGRLLSIGALLVGTVYGIFSEVTKFLKLALKDTFIGKYASRISTIISEGYTNIATRLTSVFTNVSESTNGIVKKIKTNKMFSSITDAFETLGKGFKFIFADNDLIKRISDFIDPITNFFKLGKTFGSGLVRFVGKAFPLITAIITVIDTVTGAIAGYKKEGIIGAIKGGISGLLGSLVGGILDLIKGGVSWILGALGWDSAEKFLDSFSFSKLISDGVSAIIDTFVYAFNHLKDTFSIDKFKTAFEKYNILGVASVIVGGILDMTKGAVSWLLTLLGATNWAVALDGFSFQKLYENIFDGISNLFGYLGDMIQSGYKSLISSIGDVGDVASNLVKSILKNILPRENPSSKWYDPINLASSAIPDNVYKFAGITSSGAEITTTGNNSSNSAYRTSNSISKSMTKSMPLLPAELISSNPAYAAAGMTVINNVSKGGDVHNVSSSNVNNNNTNSAAAPIMSGSAIGMFWAH